MNNRDDFQSYIRKTNKNYTTRESLKQFFTSKKILIFNIIYSFYYILLILRLIVFDNSVDLIIIIFESLIFFSLWHFYLSLKLNNKISFFSLKIIRIIFILLFLIVLYILINLILLMNSISLSYRVFEYFGINNHNLNSIDSIEILKSIIMVTFCMFCYFCLINVLSNIINALKYGSNNISYYSKTAFLLFIYSILLIYVIFSYGDSYIDNLKIKNNYNDLEILIYLITIFFPIIINIHLAILINLAHNCVLPSKNRITIKL